MILIVTTNGGFASGAALPAPSATVSAAHPPGFAPENENPFTPILQLVPPGPNRAARAIAIFDRQLGFQRRIGFHPEYSAKLNEVLGELPPRQSTLIRAAALYSKPGIPWLDGPGGTHEICVAGAPRGSDYYYALAKQCRAPAAPEQFSGVFALKPVGSTDDHGEVSSVTGTLGGRLTLDTFGLGAGIDALAATLPLIRGDLKAPWDTAPGKFNRHDRAALALWHRQMPHLSAAVERYLKFSNVLDEFNSPSGPIVLFNLDAEVRESALAKYPHLRKFYGQLADSVAAESAIVDPAGNYWWRASFDRGRIRATFMDRGGWLAPFDANFKPAGPAIALNRITRGGYRTISSVRVTTLGMDFGLSNLDFATAYSREAGAVRFDTRMAAVPQLVAPPVIHGVALLIAGEFLRTLAQGNGGMRARLASDRAGAAYHYSGGFAAEFTYSPALEFLARIGDALAKEHNAAVRADERKLGEELFDAFVADYNDARPALLAMDAHQAGAAREKSK